MAGWDQRHRDARRQLMTGEYEKAYELFRTLDGQTKDPLRRLAVRVGAAGALQRQGRYDQALQLLDDLPAEDQPEWHVGRARVLRLLGRYRELLTHARRAVSLDPSSPVARRLLAETLDDLGLRDQAVSEFRWFDEQLQTLEKLPSDPEWITETGRGFLRYSELTGTNVVDRARHVLHEMFQMAGERLDRAYWPARVAAGDLLRSRFNNDDRHGSVREYQAALRINPRLPEAFVGLGEIALDRWAFEDVDRYVDEALTINPNDPAARSLRARKFLRERRYAQALEVTDAALLVNQNDLEALSARAAAFACLGDQAARRAVEDRVASINPRCALLYRVLGDAFGGIRQYQESESAYLRAVEFDPRDANARTELGMMYMQWGLEDRAREALDASWTLDPFNERTKFTLDLLDKLQHFARHETPHFVVRYDQTADPGLGPYLGDYLEDIYRQVTGDYGVQLHHRTTVEVFPTQASFAVRITGQPWIHTIGACTGWVIALASPRESPDLNGPYDLARVLRHEFTHTVTLAATDNRIPHWFTEGLAVLQEDAPRPFAWNELLADRVRRDQLFTLDSIDWGFIRPRRPDDRQAAYAQSEWMCEFLIERFGYDVLNAMVQGYLDGKTQEQVMRERLDLTTAAFDQQFKTWSRDRAASWCFSLDPPEDPEELARSLGENPDADQLARVARAAWDAGAPEAARSAADASLERDPRNSGALEVVVRSLLRQWEDSAGDERRSFGRRLGEAAAVLEEVQPTNWRAVEAKARILLADGDYDAASGQLLKLQRLCPDHPASWRGLAGIFLRQGRDEDALVQLMELVRGQDVDADSLALLAEILVKRDQVADAIHLLERSLYFNPYHRDRLRRLADLALAAKRPKLALRTLTMLAAQTPDDPEPLDRAAQAAREAGDDSLAQTLTKRAESLRATGARPNSKPGP